MVDAEDYVDGHTVRFDLLVSTMLSSLILATYGTLAGIITEWASMPALLLTTLFESLAAIATTSLLQPAASLELAWVEASRSLPAVGPLTLAIGVVLVVVAWRVQVWVTTRVAEVFE